MSAQLSVKVLCCSECNNNYKTLYDLRKHVKKRHPQKLQDIAPLKLTNYSFKCDQCNRNFSHKHHLKFHLKKIHCASSSAQNLNSTGKPHKKCPLCQYGAKFKKDLYKHYTEIHNVSIEIERLEFATDSEFISWKEKFERESKSKFVKERGSRGKITNYACHRSGFYVSESTGQRHIKTQGTNKINGFCPAEIKLTFNSNARCTVDLIKTHVGHQNEVGHLYLTPSERQSLATKIASKIPFDAILNEIRDSVSGSSLERMHLLTRKDLYNIESNFNLQSEAVRHQNDAVSIDAWVNEMKDDCILLYKPQDIIMEEYPQLRKEDFLLVIMNKAQTTIFKEFSMDCICIDGTHGLNSYNFELHTVLILDDLRQGFPCAFCISSRSDEIVMKLFFECLKKQTGPVETKVFMSDMSEIYYNAWMEVMSEAQYRLYCTWHVDRAWRKHLNLVHSKERQAALYKKLRTLLQETDATAFECMAKIFLQQILEDEETVKFGEYFRDYYMKKTKSWAYCYRLNCGINTNMHVERMHKTIKYIYLHGKNVKRLDKAAHALMKFIRDKLFDRIIVLNKGKICSKQKELRKRHKCSINLKTELICKSGNLWQIPSTSYSKTSKTLEVYTVSENEIQCNCQLVCDECNICIHKYSCTCLDYAIKWNMCKHIHLVCRHRKSEQPPTDNLVQEENTELTIFENRNLMETETILEQISKPSTSGSNRLIERKNEIVRRFQTVVDNIQTEVEFETLEKLMKSVEPTLLAVRQNSSKPVQQQHNSNGNRIPSNKNISQQRRLFSTKKKNAKKVSHIVKPNEDECNTIALNLLQ